jgi:hypothetical protein
MWYLWVDSSAWSRLEAALQQGVSTLGTPGGNRWPPGHAQQGHIMLDWYDILLLMFFLNISNEELRKESGEISASEINCRDII